MLLMCGLGQMEVQYLVWVLIGKFIFRFLCAIMGGLTLVWVSRQIFELIQMKKSPPWMFSSETKVALPGAHGTEIVRSLCFLDKVSSWIFFGLSIPLADIQ